MKLDDRPSDLRSGGRQADAARLAGDCRGLDRGASYCYFAAHRCPRVHLRHSCGSCPIGQRHSTVDNLQLSPAGDLRTYHAANENCSDCWLGQMLHLGHKHHFVLRFHVSTASGPRSGRRTTGCGRDSPLYD